MNNKEDKLLKSFFDAQRQEIEDNGFSRKVMHRLPLRQKRLAQIWTAVCLITAVSLFFALNGLELVLGAFKEGALHVIQNGVAQMDLQTIGIIAIVCIGLIIQKINSYSL